MNDPLRQIEGAIAALDAQRALLGDAVVDLAIGPLRERLAAAQQARAQVTPPAAPTPEAKLPKQHRRLVSVLFTDIVGSTSLSQNLDPEEIHQVMDGALAAFTRCVDRHRGRVLQYAGDSMLAAFGADGASEDDAERAVRAALEVLDEGRRRGREVARRFGHEGFDVRVGVHTGPVLLGGGVDDEGSIRGMTVNVAARLEQTAPPGTLRISHDTWRLVRAAFDAERQPPLQVKGRDEPLVSYFVRGPRVPRPGDDSRGIEGVGSVLIGREAERALLDGHLHAACAQPGVRAVRVEAEAGIGKSRLVRAWLGGLARTPRPHQVLHVRAVPSTLCGPYELLRHVLLAALDVESDAPVQAVLRAMADALDDHGPVPPAARAQQLAHLLGFEPGDGRLPADARDAGAQIVDQALRNACELLHARARQAAPALVVVADDLHWADDASVGFLQRLLQHPMPNASLLLVLLARPTLRERRTWLADDAALPTVALQPLDIAHRGALADALLAPFGAAPPPDVAALRALLLNRAGGNPYYMEELVQMLLDQGAIVASTTPWTLDPARLRPDRVPTTLTGVLQARLDSLPDAERTALQEASVVGLVFRDDALAAIDAAAPAALPPLQRRGLVIDDADPAAQAEPRRAFFHQLLHAVTYDTVLRSLRRRWHLRVAQWIERRPPAEREAMLGTMAAHFEQGGDTAAAVRAYAQAAARDASRFAHASAVDQAGRALELAASMPEPHAADIVEARWQALLARQRSRRLQGLLAEQEDDLAALASLAVARADPAGQATVALRRATVRLAAGEAGAAAAACEPARELARAAGTAETEVAVCCTWVGALRTLGRFDDAQRVADEGLALARAHGLRSPESELLSALAAIASDRGDAPRALALLQQSLQIDITLGSPYTECTTRINLGDAWYRLGDHERARSEFEPALTLARAIGARGFEAMALLNLAGLAHFAGDAATSLAHAARAQELAVASGSREYEAYALIALGHAALGAGGAEARAAAQAAYGGAAALLRQLGLGHLVVEADAGLLRVALDGGDLDGVRRGVAAIDAHAGTHGTSFDGTEHPAWIAESWWRGLATLGDARAEAVRHEARRRLLERASRLQDERVRQRFMHAVPHHRALLGAA